MSSTKVFTLKNWNDLIDRYNAFCQNPPSGCTAPTQITKVTAPHRWSKADIQAMQTGLKAMCSTSTFTSPIPDLWKQSIIDEITQALDNGAYCNCAPAGCCTTYTWTDVCTYHCLEHDTSGYHPCSNGATVTTNTGFAGSTAGCNAAMTAWEADMNVGICRWYSFDYKRSIVCSTPCPTPCPACPPCCFLYSWTQWVWHNSARAGQPPFWNPLGANSGESGSQAGVMAQVAAWQAAETAYLISLGVSEVNIDFRDLTVTCSIPCG